MTFLSIAVSNTNNTNTNAKQSARSLYFLRKNNPAKSLMRTNSLLVEHRDEHGFGFGLFRTGFSLFAGFGLDLDLRSRQEPNLDLDLQIFFHNFAYTLENAEMTHEPNSSFECYAVITHCFRL